MSTRGFVGYRHKNKIQGWYNHSDSYCGGLGDDVLDKYLELTQKQLRDFFLKRVKVSTDEKDYANHKDVFELDWKTESVTLEDGGQFYKDGLFCEFSYIFDLDAKEKTLLLFVGFGTKPSKGYENWFYSSQISQMRGQKAEKIYVRACPSLTGNYKSKEIAFAWMLAAMYKEASVLRKVLTCPRRQLPLLIAAIRELGDDGDNYKDITLQMYERRMKGEDFLISKKQIIREVEKDKPPLKWVIKPSRSLPKHI